MSNGPVGLSSFVERICRGEIAALARLYEIEAPNLLAVALRVTPDRRLVETVVHEVFCTLWRRPDAVGSDVRDYLVRSTMKLLEAAAAHQRRKRLVSHVRRREEAVGLRTRE